MKINRRQQNGVTILDLSGAITIGEGDIVLREAVNDEMENGTRNLLLNCASVTGIDSSGIGGLVSSYTTAQKHGGSLKLLNLTQKAGDLLVITKLMTVFEIHDDEKEAVASF
ncbi:anti-sigma B factor antagonist [Parafrankia irregularis]|uniref:Anti-sigma factor antagonist n=1 Tax=Parafrankia irregularis TaxID=795642 RepID=A0A0S4QSQ3_9ACTN|nr:MULTISPECIES: STAS domain-containing protein [Parafrankia]MBE3205895.1 STAS domain-containing protein [Parafrankia sp. CH37]CUU58159.1 anti-sigma B factor antagonist [Parafrankia irregularis]